MNGIKFFAAFAVVVLAISPVYCFAGPLEERIAVLEADVAALKANAAVKMATDGYLQYDPTGVREGVIGPHAIFEGVNVHVLNGDGMTYTENGKGNLFVGYNEIPSDYVDGDRFGSHNLVTGDSHKFRSQSGLFAGATGTSNAYGTVILGGRSVVNGNFGIAIGGYLNTVGNSGVVIGGRENSSGGGGSVVVGGFQNVADGEGATVTGGSWNLSSGMYSSVSGGESVQVTNSNGWAAGSLSQ